jgi:hypothetical protein
MKKITSPHAARPGPIPFPCETLRPAYGYFIMPNFLFFGVFLFGILSHLRRIFFGIPIITSILSADSFAFLLEYLNCLPLDKGTYPQPLSFGIRNTFHYNYLNLWS